jgi:hypothetical protein
VLLGSGVGGDTGRRFSFGEWVYASTAGARSPKTGRAAPAAVVQKALLMNSSVGLGLGKAVSLPGLASVKKGRNTVPCESRPW